MLRVAYFVLRVPFGVERGHYPSSFALRQAPPNAIRDSDFGQPTLWYNSQKVIPRSTSEPDE